MIIKGMVIGREKFLSQSKQANTTYASQKPEQFSFGWYSGIFSKYCRSFDLFAFSQGKFISSSFEHLGHSKSWEVARLPPCAAQNVIRWASERNTQLFPGDKEERRLCP